MATCKDCVRHSHCVSDWHKLSRVEHICNNFKTNADFVEVVRCKDCRHYKQNPYSPDEDMMCMYWCDWLPTDPDDFCSCGERKDESE